MAVATDKLKEQISTLADETDEGNVSQQYVSGLKSIDRSPASTDDITTRLAELKQLFPVQKAPTFLENIFDLASSLSQGLAMNAQSARPTSLGYGLSAGFNIFNQQARKKREEANALQRELILLARKEVQQEKASEIALQEKGLEAVFKIELEKIKAGSEGFFKGKGDTSVSLNYILKAATDPSMVFDEFGQIKPEYAMAVAIVEQPKIVSTETGASAVTTFNVDKVFREVGLTPPTELRPQSAPTPTDTGQRTKEGKKIFRLPNGNVVVEM